MGFPDITFAPDTDYKALIDKLQRFFQAARKYWVRIGEDDEIGVPVGGIIVWSGYIEDIPEGWAVCDGENGTPDLRENFILT